MGTTQSFRDLRVWQEGVALVRDVYRVADSLPETYSALADQLRRAARSVPANIAEGNGKSSRRDYVRMLHDSRGSLQELETDVESLSAVPFAHPDDIALLRTRVKHVGVLLNALIRSLKPPP